MRISKELLYQILKEKYTVIHFGRGIKSRELPLPNFYDYNTTVVAGKVYVARTQDLPDSCSENCLFICVGSRPTQINRYWDGEVLYIDDRTLEFFTLFNFIISTYDKITNWQDSMKRLLEDNANIEEYVKVSLPIFENCISIADYDLRLLVNCSVDRSTANSSIVIDREFKRIPDKVSATFMAKYVKYMKIREPFTYKGQLENPQGDNYCINLFLGDTYIGSCVLWDLLRPMRESDYILFQRFADYIHKAISNQSRALTNELVTVKSIFSDLLECFPVSSVDLNNAQQLLQKNMEIQGNSFGCWRCIAIKSANQGKELPPQYLCTSLEDMIPHSSVLIYNDIIVCFCMIPKGETCEETVCDILSAFLRDMNFRAGISEPFNDIFKARDYFLQASAMLKTGYSLAPEQYMYRFLDYALPYMIRNCVGEFRTDIILSQGFKDLQSLDSSVDYIETLRHYLDNECNASQTAQELFLHRSSLLPRLEKVKTIIDMKSPEERLYLRMCLYLLEYSAQEKS